MANGHVNVKTSRLSCVHESYRLFPTVTRTVIPTDLRDIDYFLEDQRSVYTLSEFSDTLLCV